MPALRSSGKALVALVAIAAVSLISVAGASASVGAKSKPKKKAKTTQTTVATTATAIDLTISSAPAMVVNGSKATKCVINKDGTFEVYVQGKDYPDLGADGYIDVVVYLEPPTTGKPTVQVKSEFNGLAFSSVGNPTTSVATQGKKLTFTAMPIASSAGPATLSGTAVCP